MNIVVALLPYIVGSALVPLQIIIGLLLPLVLRILWPSRSKSLLNGASA